jgi:hypothetical protein
MSSSSISALQPQAAILFFGETKPETKPPAQVTTPPRGSAASIDSGASTTRSSQHSSVDSDSEETGDEGAGSTDGVMHRGDFAKRANERGQGDADGNGIAGQSFDEEHAKHETIKEYRQHQFGGNSPGERVAACVEEFGAKETWADQKKVIAESGLSPKQQEARLKEVKGEIQAAEKKLERTPSFLD